METFFFASAVRGCRVYGDVWKPSIGEKLLAKRELNKHAVKVVKGDETVGHTNETLERTSGKQDSSLEPLLRSEQTAPLRATTSNESNYQHQGFSMFNLYLLKAFNSICDNNKPVYSL